eukprot:UN29128
MYCTTWSMLNNDVLVPYDMQRFGREEPFTKHNRPYVCRHAFDYHMMEISINGDGTVTIKLGHPKDTDHYIEYMALKDESNKVIWEKFYGVPTDSAMYWENIEIGANVLTITGFVKCIVHGYYETEPIIVGGSNNPEPCDPPNTEISTMFIQPFGDFYISWFVDFDENKLHVDLQFDIGSDDRAWFAVGWGRESSQHPMTNADMFVAYYHDDNLEAWDKWSLTTETPNKDFDYADDCFDSVTVEGWYLFDGMIVVNVTRSLEAFDPCDNEIPDTDIVSLFARKRGVSYSEGHGFNDRTFYSINWQSGDYAKCDGLTDQMVLKIHGLIMVLMFIVCYPVAVFGARYCT